MSGLAPEKMRSTAVAVWYSMTRRPFACPSTSSTCRTLRTLPSLSHQTRAWSARRTTPSCSCCFLGTAWNPHPDGSSPDGHNWRTHLQFVVKPCAYRTKTSSISWHSNPFVLHSGLYLTSSRSCFAWPEKSGYWPDVKVRFSTYDS